jgi:UDP-glucose 4-epimerase
VTGRDIKVRIGDRRPGDPPVLVASSGKIQRELGWEPHHNDLEEIIKSVWDFMLKKGMVK